MQMNINYTITSIELFYLIREWKDALLDGRIDKIYQEEGVLSFKIYNTGIGNIFLNFHLPGFAYTTSEKIISSMNLPHFAAYLRKYASNARIKDIKQLSKRERIFEIVIEKEKVYRLIFELLPPGNLIFCDDDYLILSPFKPKKFSNRTIRARVKYEMDVRPDFTKETFKESLINSKKKLVKALAIDISLSGKYAEELCFISKIDKDTETESLKNEDIDLLYKNYLDLFNRNIEPYTNQKHIFPFNLLSQEGLVKTNKGFNESIFSLISLKMNEKKENPELKKKKLIIQQQEEAIKNLEKNAELHQKIGELIYEHYQEILALMNDIKSTKGHINNEKIQELISKYNFLKKVDMKNRKLELEF
jgi:predicted ribosome quality control (RQC) complex YloA/Tae2 family protein